MERGNPLAIVGSVDHLIENIQKAACLQMMYEREPKPHFSSPMMLPVDPETRTPMIRGFPKTLKPIAIQLQGRSKMPLRQNYCHIGKSSYPNRPVNSRKAWTSGELVQELINYGRKYGLIGGSQHRMDSKVVRMTEIVPLQKLLGSKMSCFIQVVRGRANFLICKAGGSLE